MGLLKRPNFHFENAEIDLISKKSTKTDKLEFCAGFLGSLLAGVCF